MKTSAKNTSA